MTTMENLNTLARNRGIVVGVSTIAAAAGFLAGFKYAQMKMEQVYADKLGVELSDAQAYYKRLYKQGEFETPEAAVEALIPTEAVEALREYAGGKESPPVDPEPPAVYERARLWRPGEVANEAPPQERRNNIFDNAKPHQSVPFDYSDEVRNRTEEAPYIISQDEHGENETEFRQITLTYYEGDGVLCDERDDKIDEIDQMVGDDNIVRFGHRSGDNNVVYVRNHVLELEIEIVRHEGKYSEMVLGIVPKD